MQFFEDLSLYHILGPALSGISRQSLVKIVCGTAMLMSIMGRNYKRNVRMARSLYYSPCSVPAPLQRSALLNRFRVDHAKCYVQVVKLFKF